VEWNIAKVRADQVWSDFDITGRRVVVANMDSGADWTHPALQGQYRGADGNHDYNWFDFTDTYPSAPNDGHDHGTHTMGTIVGDDGGANQIGMAPGAQWIAVKVFDDFGVTDDVKLHQGFQWILAPTDLDGENPDPSKAPDVVNNSWGAAVEFCNPEILGVYDPLIQAFGAIVNGTCCKRISVVFAEGAVITNPHSTSDEHEKATRVILVASRSAANVAASTEICYNSAVTSQGALL